MMAAITACQYDCEVTIFEKNSRVGKKILSTGNGRCNITNDHVLEKDTDGNLLHYHGDDPSFPLFSLQEFSHKSLLDFFENLGVLFRCEEGKYYPYSETAATILDVLRFYCEKCNVTFATDAEIDEITEDKGRFVVGKQLFDKVIVACGGMSSPHFGSDGSGYALLCKFGHQKTKLSPAITQITTENKYTRPLKGIKCNANVTAFSGKTMLREEYGQVLFAEYGVSGPPIFQLSSYFRDASTSDMRIEMDFFPEYTFGEVCNTLFKIQSNSFMDDLTAENFLVPMLHKKIGQIIIKSCDLPLSLAVDMIPPHTIKKIANTLKHFPLRVSGTKSFANAQVTLGGIKSKDFSPLTMESKLKRGIYACGEILDVTGDCGGYNLQWAFSSGFIAGRSAALD